MVASNYYILDTYPNAPSRVLRYFVSHGDVGACTIGFRPAPAFSLRVIESPLHHFGYSLRGRVLGKTERESARLDLVDLPSLRLVLEQQNGVGRKSAVCENKPKAGRA